MPAKLTSETLRLRAAELVARADALEKLEHKQAQAQERQSWQTALKAADKALWSNNSALCRRRRAELTDLMRSIAATSPGESPDILWTINAKRTELHSRAVQLETRSIDKQIAAELRSGNLDDAQVGKRRAELEAAFRSDFS